MAMAMAMIYSADLDPVSSDRPWCFSKDAEDAEDVEGQRVTSETGRRGVCLLPFRSEDLFNVKMRKDVDKVCDSRLPKKGPHFELTIMVSSYYNHSYVPVSRSNAQTVSSCGVIDVDIGDS